MGLTGKSGRPFTPNKIVYNRHVSREDAIKKGLTFAHFKMKKTGDKNGRALVNYHGGIAGQISITGKYAIKVVDDMAVVREHYGINVADALRLSLHLHANAIRANKARVEI